VRKLLIFLALPALAEDGIPVTSQLVMEKCSPCHKKDDKGNLSRISWERTTPEGWQQALKRMIRLNGVTVTPEEARQIVRYLANHHGLAPEEARPALYQPERRMQDETAPNDQVRDACMSCHTWGRVISWRRSKEEWDLLVKLHIGLFPTVETVTFRRPPPPPDAPPSAPGTDNRDPVDRAIEYIAKAFPLHTPEWANWRASMRSPKLAGRWLVSGSQLGQGWVVGEFVIESTADPDQFTTRTRLRYVGSGRTMTRSGRAVVYTGYAWRGSSTSQEEVKSLREVMMVSRDQSQIEGRWFWGGYDEFGIDVTLRRATSEPVLLALDRAALRAGASGERVEIFGDNLPVNLTPADVDLGAGVSVRRIVSQGPTSVVAQVDIAKDALSGKRDVALRRAVAVGALAVYDTIDYVKVMPEAALARLGGTTHPKGFQQFEAIGYHRGADNKPHTPDDVSLGPLEVVWSVEEFFSTYGDDDKEFVGTITPSGLFLPALEGPNPQRQFSRNNYGDVWVVATSKEKDKNGRAISGRAHLVVTIPLYVRWDQPEVAP
jgi:quinohemoprotein amine dehydrogenase